MFRIEAAAAASGSAAVQKGEALFYKCTASVTSKEIANNARVVCVYDMRLCMCVSDVDYCYCCNTVDRQRNAFVRTIVSYRYRLGRKKKKKALVLSFGEKLIMKGILD